MADIQILGHISNIKYNPESILIMVDENKNGYRKPNGEIVEAKVFQWRCYFSGNESKRHYINKYFNRGMLVQVKGEIVPYTVENGNCVDGYSIYIQTINRASYPTTAIKMEKKLIRETQSHSSEKPNFSEYRQDDF